MPIIIALYVSILGLAIFQEKQNPDASKSC